MEAHGFVFQDMQCLQILLSRRIGIGPGLSDNIHFNWSFAALQSSSDHDPVQDTDPSREVQLLCQFQ